MSNPTIQIEYAVFFNDTVCHVFTSRELADNYIDGGVAAGWHRDCYDVRHRHVTTLTTGWMVD